MCGFNILDVKVGLMDNEKNACKFFIWVDLPTCLRGLEYGKQLQNKIKELQKMKKDLKRLHEVAEMDKEKMLKKMDKLWKMNHELKKKNEMMWKCNVLCMVVISLLLVLCLGNWKSTYGRMLYLPSMFERRNRLNAMKYVVCVSLNMCSNMYDEHSMSIMNGLQTVIGHTKTQS
ncbi:hypothetical protein RHMOL_Rhmol06G0201600 [Rhododendron molle]|uniref:Uncharacterized protein n=1 Tax=Rhododendron molle TaxID=49168 RepID=A0ACC0NEW9_RHOML|nr:hypothetical protein RHMOL_Rhmol06G0201600 [Rhododendron molle]